jgi:general secretion pathway protein E
METTPHRKGWLPKLNPVLAPRLNALLQPGSLADGVESAEPLARAVLEDALQSRVTDVHFEPFSVGWRVRVRVDGIMHDAAQLAPEAGQKLVRYFRTSAKLDPVICYIPQDANLQFEVQGRKVDLRLATVPCFGGEKLALRLLDPRQLQHSIRDLGLGEDEVNWFERWLGQDSGMCLVAGPTGSGKTTTLYALLHELELSNHTVVTIEDPIEYPIDGIAQIQVDMAHGLNFATGLRAMLRLDPDYLLVGEMRDVESAQVTVEAAASGHFVMSTLHCPDASGVITLLRNWSVSDPEIATVLQVVVNQRLVRRLCSKCRREDEVSDDARAWLTSLGLPAPSKLWLPVGCEACQKTGYHGRVGVFEVWHKDESDYRLILDHADEHALRVHLRERGLKTVMEDGLAKVREGVTSLSEIQQMGSHAGLSTSKPVRRSRRSGRSPTHRKAKHARATDTSTP